MRLPSTPFVFMSPVILIVFAVCFLVFWLSERKRRYLLFFAISNSLFCLGSLSQILYIPPGVGPNAVVSAFLYTLSSLLLCDGLLQRSSKRLTVFFHMIALVSITGGIAYFVYIDRSLLIRVYVLNFGLGIIFLFTLWNLHELRSGPVPEKVLFWLFFAFTLQFFIRTPITIQGAPTTETGFNLSAFWFVLQFTLAIMGTGLALAVLAVIVNDKLSLLQEERSIDPLSGLLNRRGFKERANTILDRGGTSSIGLMIIDIDHFKSINDSYGHSVGDSVIIEIAQIIRQITSSKNALAARLGGEEFAVLISLAEPVCTIRLAESIRKAVQDRQFAGIVDTQKVTISIGVATMSPHFSLDHLLEFADGALYKAKRSGRNRVES
ncbi:GGDEF domain-containing protein [Ochrobactrum sp. POC9]|nr:GGDEF domain-containing protein [Ochrobactrum sp. POC9]